MDRTAHAAEAGDVIVIAGHHVGEAERIGEILEVLGEMPHGSYRVAGTTTSRRVPSGQRRHDQALDASTCFPESKVMTAHTPPKSLVQQLEEASIAYELIDHPRTTTAAAEAHVLGLDSREVAKTVVLSTPDGFLRAALPASERLDLGKVRALLGTKDVQLATEVVLAGAYPDFELGAVPPLTGGDGDRVLMDRRLCENEWVVLEAGTHEQSLRLRATDLVQLSDARVVDLSQD